MREERHREEYLRYHTDPYTVPHTEPYLTLWCFHGRLKEAFEKPKKILGNPAEVKMKSGKGTYDRDGVWHHKRGYGQLVEVSCQTEYSATILEERKEAAEGYTALAAIERPYLKLRTHWSQQAPDERNDTRGVRTGKALAFYGTSDGEAQTEMASLLEKPLLTAEDNQAHVFLTREDVDGNTPLFGSLSTLLQDPEYSAAALQTEFEKTSGNYIDRLLNEKDWYEA